MLKIDALNENRVLSITARGKLTKDQYLQLLPELEKILQKSSPLRFYIKLEEFTGLELGALWEDIKFDYKHKNNFGKKSNCWKQKMARMGIKICWLLSHSSFISECFYVPKNYLNKRNSVEKRMDM